jgi:glucose uptake protein
MYQPETYVVALSFMIATMFCWGSWANTMKLCPGFRFQLFYWDYAVGLVVSSLVWGMTLGSCGSTGLPLFADLAHSDAAHIWLAVAGGVTFNIANLLLVAAINLSGLAVAFPVGIGLALVVGAVSSYCIAPRGNPWMLFGGIVLVVAAILCDAAAYRAREGKQAAASRRGLILSVVAGLLMGLFYPFVSRAMSGESALGPYSTSLVFAIAVLLSTIPANAWLMRRPLDGDQPVGMKPYFAAPARWHLWGLLGGVIWCTGTTLNFVASRTTVVGPATSYSIGQGATMISAAWGVFVWHEFASAPAQAKRLVVAMFALFIAGLLLVALAPLY